MRSVSFMLITLRAFCAKLAEEITRRKKAENVFFMMTIEMLFKIGNNPLV